MPIAIYIKTHYHVVDEPEYIYDEYNQKQKNPGYEGFTITATTFIHEQTYQARAWYSKEYLHSAEALQSLLEYFEDILRRMIAKL